MDNMHSEQTGLFSERLATLEAQMSVVQLEQATINSSYGGTLKKTMNIKKLIEKIDELGLHNIVNSATLNLH